MGGALAAIESGYTQNEIQEAAYAFQQALEGNDKIVVGLNLFVTDEPLEIERLTVDPTAGEHQRELVRELRERRDNERVSALRARLAAAAHGSDNLMPLFIECVEHDVTLGEICHTLRGEWGEYKQAFDLR